MEQLTIYMVDELGDHIYTLVCSECGPAPSQIVGTTEARRACDYHAQQHEATFNREVRL